MGRKPVAMIVSVSLLGCSGAGGEVTNAGGASGAGQQSAAAGMAGNLSAGGTAGNSQSSGIAGTAQEQAGAGQGGQSSMQPDCGPGCFPLCEGGMCQCECSSVMGCDSVGWQLHTIAWDQFGHPDREGGVELCMPETWALVQASGTMFTDGERSLSVSAEVRLDHADALRRLSDSDVGHCAAEDYEVSFVRAGTLPADQWPALLQTYRELPAACGACPSSPLPTEINRVAHVSIAYGEYVLTTHASVPESMADPAQVIAIGRTARTQTELTSDQAGAEVADLITQHAADCP